MRVEKRGNWKVVAASAFALAASSGAHSADRKDGSDCAGFAAKDAADWLKVPAEQVIRSVNKVHGSLWVCSYAAGKSAPGISFSIAIAPSAAKAASEMETYRDHLSTTGGTAPYRDKLPKGAYSDIMGVGAGDEAVWTDINATLTVRKGNVTEERFPPVRDHFALEMDHFSECVMSGKEPLTPGEEGLRVMKLIMAVYEAAKSGKTIRL